MRSEQNYLPIEWSYFFLILKTNQLHMKTIYKNSTIVCKRWKSSNQTTFFQRCNSLVSTFSESIHPLHGDCAYLLQRSRTSYQEFRWSAYFSYSFKVTNIASFHLKYICVEEDKKKNFKERPWISIKEFFLRNKQKYLQIFPY